MYISKKFLNELTEPERKKLKSLRKQIKKLRIKEKYDKDHNILRKI